MVATDLNVDGEDYGWVNWDWTLPGASRHIEVLESQDLHTWSDQRHVLVAQEIADMTYAPKSIWDPEIGAYVVYWTSLLYPLGTSRRMSTTCIIAYRSLAMRFSMMYADQKWYQSPAGEELEEQLKPYWTDDLASGQWTPTVWRQKPDYKYAMVVIRHGHIERLTTAEHAALRGAELWYISITRPPFKAVFEQGEAVDLTGLRISATYSDAVVDDELFEGYGGYELSYSPANEHGVQIATARYMVLNTTKKASFSITRL